MKNLIIKTITLGAAIVLSLAGSSAVSARVRTYNFKDFTKLDLGRTIEEARNSRGEQPGLMVNVVKSDTFKVEFDVSDEYAELYDLKLSGDVLKISVRRTTRAGKYAPRPKAEATVYMPVIEAVEAHGLTELRFDGDFETSAVFHFSAGGATKVKHLSLTAPSAVIDFSGASAASDLTVKTSEKTSFDFSGASNITELNLEAEEIKGKLSGASNVYNGTWNAATLTLGVSGASNIKRAKVALKEAEIAVSGASNVKFDAIMENAGVKASGASYLSVNGEAEMAKISASGSSRVDCSEFLCKEVIVSASGVARVDFNATERTTYSMSGQATVRPHGKGNSVKIENGKTTVRMGYDD